MIIEQVLDKDCKVELTGQKVNYTIAASAKAFKILSDNLYQRKIEAVIRELMCNALDSHIAAGKKEPFKVHLPSILSPTFIVEDFGVGMDDQSFINLMSTYFMSDKTSTNAQVGGLGLGSKSPYCYTSQFTAISTKNGVTGTYLCYLDEHDEPSITTVSLQKTDKPNGVRIEVPVQQKDFNQFESTYKQLVYFFPKEYVEDTKNFVDEYELFVDRTYVAKKENIYHRGFIKIKMGPVIYETHSNDIGEVATDFYKFYANLGKGIVFEFDIGELDIQPSRESITLNKKNIDIVSKRLCEVKEAYIQYFKGVYRKCKTHQDKIRFYVDHRNILSDILGKDFSYELMSSTKYPSLSISNINSVYAYPKIKFDESRKRNKCTGRHELGFRKEFNDVIYIPYFSMHVLQYCFQDKKSSDFECHKIPVVIKKPAKPYVLKNLKGQIFEGKEDQFYVICEKGQMPKESQRDWNVFYISDRASKKFIPGKANNLNDLKILTDIITSSNIRRAEGNGLMMFGKFKPNNFNTLKDIRLFGVDPDIYDKAMRDAIDPKKKFPLLFGVRTKELIDEYIQFIEGKTNATSSN